METPLTVRQRHAVLRNKGLAYSEAMREIRLYRGDFDDALQTAFVALMHAVQWYDSRKAALTTYATRSIRHELTKVRNRSKRLRTVSGEIEVAVQYDPSSRMDRREQIRSVQQAIGKLEKRLRIVLTKHDLENQTYEQIGSLLGLTKQRAHQLRNEAVARLADRLSE